MGYPFMDAFCSSYECVTTPFSTVKLDRLNPAQAATETAVA